MKLRSKIAAIAAAALAVAGGSTAYAAVAADRVGPPTQNPAFGEYNYAPGAVVFLCVNETTQLVRVETRTDTAPAGRLPRSEHSNRRSCRPRRRRTSAKTTW